MKIPTRSTPRLTSAATILFAFFIVSYFLRTAGRAAPHLDWGDCLEVVEHVKGENCGSSDSFRIKVKNTCDETIDAKFCIEKVSGEWACGMDSGMKSADTTTYYDCHSTARVWKWAREAGSKTKIPNPPAK